MSVLWGMVLGQFEDEQTRQVEELSEARDSKPVRDGVECFQCGEAVGFPVVSWMGWGSRSESIYLHPACAAQLAAGLLEDWSTVQSGVDRARQARVRSVEQHRALFRLQSVDQELRSRDALLQERARNEAALRGEMGQLDRRFKEASRQLAELQSRPVPSQAAAGVRLDPQRNFSKLQRREIYLRSNAHCVGCGNALGPVWHADHIVPHSRGGRTEVSNGQALCPGCNGRKSAKILTVDEEG